MKNRKEVLGLKVKVLVFIGVFTIFTSLCLFQFDSMQALAEGWSASCTNTSMAAFKACNHEVKNDYWISIGNCNNLSKPEERKKCKRKAAKERLEAKEECRNQFDARMEICDELGEAPYDPVISPDDFVDFEEIVNGGSFTPNLYFPLVLGTSWEYLTKDGNGVVVERTLVEVLNETKEILNINCIVVRDRVWEYDEEGEESLIEDTRDWYAQDNEGNVWYFGEIVLNYEDDELADLEGSWKAGKDSAKGGFLMLANPEKSNYYRQEFSLGNAEDMAEVISRGEESVNVPYGNFTDDVLKTRDFTPLEPDVNEFKYYAPGVGMVLEVNPDTGERVELINKTTP